MTSRPIILCFVAYYLPGYRSGGPVRTIANFVDHLGDEFDIRIVTRDRDALDTAPYPGVEVDAWNAVGQAQVFYASKETLTLPGVGRLLRDIPHDLLYLNSFFAFSFTGLPLLARRFGLAPKRLCVIAPRGEFSSGAIALKALKKRLYLTTAKAIGLYHGLQWQASSEFEAQDIRRELGTLAESIHVAPDLPPKLKTESDDPSEQQARAPGPLRIIFLSRISPMKNLDFLLAALQRISQPMNLTIIGPLLEPEYWGKCQRIIKTIKQPVTVDYQGEVTPLQVLETFARHDLFVLPTRGENYGHVILESLSAGTPVLVSDQTPWQDSGDDALQTLVLDSLEPWIKSIETWALLSESELLMRRKLAATYAYNYIRSSGVVEQNRQLFQGALST